MLVELLGQWNVILYEHFEEFLLGFWVDEERDVFNKHGGGQHAIISNGFIVTVNFDEEALSKLI